LTSTDRRRSYAQTVTRARRATRARVDRASFARARASRDVASGRRARARDAEEVPSRARALARGRRASLAALTPRDRARGDHVIRV